MADDHVVLLWYDFRQQSEATSASTPMFPGSSTLVVSVLAEWRHLSEGGVPAHPTLLLGHGALQCDSLHPQAVL